MINLRRENVKLKKNLHCISALWYDKEITPLQFLQKVSYLFPFLSNKVQYLWTVRGISHVDRKNGKAVKVKAHNNDLLKYLVRTQYIKKY